MDSAHDQVGTGVAGSEVPVEDNSIEQAAADAPLLMDHEINGGEHDEMDVLTTNERFESDADTAKVGFHVNSVGEQTTAVVAKLVEQELDVQANEGKGEGIMKLVDEATIVDHGNADISVVNGHVQVDSSVGCCIVDVDCKVCGGKDKAIEGTDATYLVEHTAASGEQGASNESVANGCDHTNTGYDGEPTQIEVCTKEMKAEQSSAGGVEIVENVTALTIEGHGSEGDTEVTNREMPRGEEAYANGHHEEGADDVAEPEPLVKEAHSEATLVIVQLEDKYGSEREEIVHDTGASHAYKIVEEAESQAEQSKNKAAGDVTELKEGFVKKIEEALPVGELANHEAVVNSLQPVEPSSYSTVEVQKEDMMDLSNLEESSLASSQQRIANSIEDTEGQKQSDTPGSHITGKNDSDKLDTRLEQEPNTEVVDGTQLQQDPAAVGAAFHIESRSSDLENDEGVVVESSIPAEPETPYNATKEGNGFKENFNSAIAHIEFGAFKEHETCVKEGEAVSQTRNESGNVATAKASFSKEDKPNGIDKDGESIGHTRDPYSENTVDDQLGSCNISTPSDIVSPGTGNMDSLTVNDPASLAETHLKDSPCREDDLSAFDGACNEISLENADTFTTSPPQVETKYVKDLESPFVETIISDDIKDDDKAVIGETKIIDGSRASQLDVDKENRGNASFITPQRIYIIKVPRFAGEDMWAKIQDAQVRMDQLTQKRDAINVQRQKQKALCDEYREKLEVARQEERGARAAHGDKRHDLNSVQTMIGKLNKANSIQEIDEMIARKDKTIVHESISLKEEKLLLQEIKELKAQRKQLCSHMGSKAEMDEAFHQKERIHEQHKTLKKDSGELLTNLKSLEEKTKVAQKAYDDQRAALRKLNEEHRAANEIRQNAYFEWSELKKEPGKKNQHFLIYRKDKDTSFDYLSKGDMVGLQLHCNDQVERFMGMWNKDDEFRRQYVESNKVSTLRRLGASDGRRIGPDEIPPEIPSRPNRKQSNPSPLPVSSGDVLISSSDSTPAKSTSVITPIAEESFPVLQGPQSSKHSKSNFPGSSSVKETTAATVTEREDAELIEKEKMRRVDEDFKLAQKAAELAAKEEELRQEKVAAEKEQLRLEQKAKAKEAEERKRRKAEKARQRADYRAQKDAEMKKAKQDKKKGTSVDSANGSVEGNAEAIARSNTAASTSTNVREIGVPEHTAQKKKLSRPSIALKQLNRVEPMPLPLRNRGKSKMRQYIMVSLVVMVSVVVLFLAGNYASSGFKALPF